MSDELYGDPLDAGDPIMELIKAERSIKSEVIDRKGFYRMNLRHRITRDRMSDEEIAAKVDAIFSKVAS